jgi:BMFP domain-containing protein YqiC
MHEAVSADEKKVRQAREAAEFDAAAAEALRADMRIGQEALDRRLAELEAREAQMAADQASAQ